MNKFSTIILLTIVTLGVKAQVNSVLSEGKWAKMGIVSEGVYKLSRNDLISMSMNPSDIDPRNIRIFGTGGMLSQKLEVNVPLDPSEIAIYIEGEEDGSFDTEDYVLFYAKGSHWVEPDGNLRKFTRQRSYYSDTAYFYINFAENLGKRITETESIAGTYPIIDSYEYTSYFENDFYNRLGSGREWWGEKFNSANNTGEYSWNVSNVKNNTNIKVYASVMGYSFYPTEFDININGITVGSLQIPSVNDYEFDDKGVKVSAEYSLSSSLVSGPEYTTELLFNPSGLSSISDGYLDYLIMQFERDLRLDGDQLRFSSFASLDQAVSGYELISSVTDIMLWDISDPENIGSQNFNSSPGGISWASPSDVLHSFVAFDPQATLLKPVVTELMANQNIKGNASPDLIIVTHPKFKSELEKLKSFREANDGLDVLLLTTEEVFNEFSYGIPDPSAIRNMAYYFYSENGDPGKLKYMLLAGRGSYDYKNIRKGGLNYLPIYQSRESLDPLRTFSSDDYYSFLELGEGEWLENSGGNHTMDISVGRFPVKTISEASVVVDKLIHYNSNETLGEWRKKIVFVADDGDFNIHQSQSDQLTRYVDTTYKKYDMKKLYLDNFVQVPRAGGEKSPSMTEAINRAIEEGSLIVNYTGHGGESGWAQEFVLDEFIVDEWKNYDRLPLLVTATCEFGRHDNPVRISTGEKTLLNPNGGSIGLVSTSRPVFSSTNFQLNRAFYESVFEESTEGGLNLGEIFKRTKNNSINGVFNRNFSLLGDPSMKLAVPRFRIVLDEVNEKPLSEADTLGAMGTVLLRGRVVDNGLGTVTGFNGVVDVVLYDKQRTLTTLGDENPPWNYKDWNNRLFSGQATVENGLFEIDFILPKNTIYSIGDGKVSMYAMDLENGQDASGSELSIKTGGEAEGTIVDNSPPAIELFMNDESFLNGSKVPSDSRLLVKLSDESGINISGLGVGQQLEAILDGETVYSLNAYYKADLDDFTSGSAVFDLYNLEKGNHSIKVVAWDNQNNVGEQEIDFVVSESEEMVIHRVIGAPNPFYNETVISVEHNRPGDDLDVFLTIHDRMGKVVWQQDYMVENSPIRIELLAWGGQTISGQKIEQGIYIVSVMVRSLRDGSKNKGYSKLINMK